MANVEVAKFSQVFSKDFGACVAGISPTLALDSSFFGGVSRVLGVVRKTSGGTVGTSAQFVISTAVSAAAGTPVGRLYSQNALDTSTYTLFWINELGPSSSSLIPC